MSEYLYQNVIKRLSITKDSHIIELGCGECENLHYLAENGFNKLFGVEINDKAVNEWIRTYPDDMDSIWVFNRSIEKFLSREIIHMFYMVYTVGALKHIHPDLIENVIKGMVRISRRYIAIIEWESDEINTGGERIWGRQYKPLFEKYGCKEIYTEAVGDQADKHLSTYTLRIFEVK